MCIRDRSKPVTSVGGSKASFILSETGKIGNQNAKINISIIAQRKLGVTTPKSEINLATLSIILFLNFPERIPSGIPMRIINKPDINTNSNVAGK